MHFERKPMPLLSADKLRERAVIRADEDQKVFRILSLAAAGHAGSESEKPNFVCRKCGRAYSMDSDEEVETCPAYFVETIMEE